MHTGHSAAVEHFQGASCMTDITSAYAPLVVSSGAASELIWTESTPFSGLLHQNHLALYLQYS